jgi:hypothetical protein
MHSNASILMLKIFVLFVVSITLFDLLRKTIKCPKKTPQSILKKQSLKKTHSKRVRFHKNKK